MVVDYLDGVEQFWYCQDIYYCCFFGQIDDFVEVGWQDGMQCLWQNNVQCVLSGGQFQCGGGFILFVVNVEKVVVNNFCGIGVLYQGQVYYCCGELFQYVNGLIVGSGDVGKWDFQ